eukprot:5534727-Pleurochrysis_carterae.AAC.1
MCRPVHKVLHTQSGKKSAAHAIVLVRACVCERETEWSRAKRVRSKMGLEQLVQRTHKRRGDRVVSESKETASFIDRTQKRRGKEETEWRVCKLGEEGNAEAVWKIKRGHRFAGSCEALMRATHPRG